MSRLPYSSGGGGSGKAKFPGRPDGGEQQQQPGRAARTAGSLDRLGVASLAVDHREGHGEMALPAVLALEDFDHRVLGRARLDREDLRVAALAPVPAECFLCEKMISFIPGTLASMSMSLGISSPLRLKETPSMKSTGLILPVASASSQPIPLPKRSFGRPAANAKKSYCACRRSFPAWQRRQRSLPVFLRVGFRAGREDRAVLVRHLPVVAGAAVEAADVVFHPDAGAVGLHRETDVDVAEPAGELRAVQPVVELGVGKLLLRRVGRADDDPPVLRRQGPAFLHSGLGADERRGSAAAKRDTKHFSHAIPPFSFWRGL